MDTITRYRISYLAPLFAGPFALLVLRHIRAEIPNTVQVLPTVMQVCAFALLGIGLVGMLMVEFPSFLRRRGCSFADSQNWTFWPFCRLGAKWRVIRSTPAEQMKISHLYNPERGITFVLTTPAGEADWIPEAKIRELLGSRFDEYKAAIDVGQEEEKWNRAFVRTFGFSPEE